MNLNQHLGLRTKIALPFAITAAALIIIGLVNGQPTAQVHGTAEDFATIAECHERAEELDQERQTPPGVGFACIYIPTEERGA